MVREINMKNFFENFDFQKARQAPGYIGAVQLLNPRFGEQLAGAALEQRKQEEAQQQQQKHEFEKARFQREEQQAEALLQGLGDVDFSDPNKALQQLQQRGLSADVATKLIGQHADIQNAKEGRQIQREELGLRHQEFNLRKAESAIKQQVNAIKLRNEEMGIVPARKLTAGELRINKQNIDKANAKASASSSVLKQIDALEKAYDVFDAEAPRGAKAGGLVSAFLPGNDEHGLWAGAKQGVENAVYSDKARAALHTIKKVNSHLLQSKINAEKGSGTQVTDILKKEIKSGLPNPEILPEARKENIKSLKQAAYKDILQQQFLTTWSQLNGRDTDEAGAAFQRFVEEVPLVDESGRVNQQALEMIPQVVSENLGRGGYEPQENNTQVPSAPSNAPSVSPRNAPGNGFNDYKSLSDEDLEARINAARTGR